MKYKTYVSLGVALLLLVGVSVPVVYAAEHQVYTMGGFIELLITKGIIPEQKAEQARKLFGIINAAESVATTTTPSVQNADKVEVTVSQYIQNGNLTFNKFEDVKGLLLMVKNTSTENIQLDAVRGCQVVYSIYNSKNELVYTSSQKEACLTKEKVTYVVKAGATRMFEVSHKQSDFSLESGTYRFELEYPGYGKGERTVTVN